MCEIVFSAINKTGDTVNGHRKDDPLEVQPNNYVWGEREDKRAHFAKFGNYDTWAGVYYTLQITDMSVDEGRSLLVPHIRPANALDDEWSAPDPEDRFIQVSRALYTLDRLNLPDVVPDNIKSLIETVGYASTTRAKIANYFKNKSTGLGLNG